MSYMRQGLSQGEALKAAEAESKVEWSLPSERRRKRDLTPPRRPTAPAKAARTDTVSTLPGGLQPCLAFLKGGCNKEASKCPQRKAHKCNIRMSKGKACGKQHAWSDHK